MSTRRGEPNVVSDGVYVSGRAVLLMMKNTDIMTCEVIEKPQQEQNYPFF